MKVKRRKNILNKNLQIKVKMAQRDFTQARLANKAGIPRSTLNQIISGRINPTELEKEEISKALGSDKRELFS